MRWFRRGDGREMPTARDADLAESSAVPTGAGPAVSVRVRDLRKTYGDFAAVDGISFDVARGEVFGFLGPNGSGKTTTIRMLTGSIAPTAGSIEVLGVDVARHAGRVAPRIGYMSQRFSLFEDMTVDENLRFYGGVYDLDDDRFARRREYILTMAGLRGHEDMLTANLSTGWRQRLALGVATIHEPELVFLDEPTSGVDPVARRQFWDLLYELSGRGVTLFVTTHYMEEATSCTRLAFMYRGRIIADGSPQQLREAHAADRARPTDGSGRPDREGAAESTGLPSLEDVFVELVTRA